MVQDEHLDLAALCFVFISDFFLVVIDGMMELRNSSFQDLHQFLAHM